MPYEHKWVDPELVLEHGGVSVYHCYKNDEFDNPMTYWFTTDCSQLQADEYSFDIRELDPNPILDYSPFPKSLKRLIDDGKIPVKLS